VNHQKQKSFLGVLGELGVNIAVLGFGLNSYTQKHALVFSAIPRLRGKEILYA
jgi:hypothetical protein